MTPTLRIASLALLALPFAAAADPADASREMHFTGPLIAAGPPVPRDVFVIQPYLLQTQVTGRYDRDGDRHHRNGVPESWRLAVPMSYGITDRLTVGATVRGAYARTLRDGRTWAVGDTTAKLGYKVFQGSGESRPVLAAAVWQNLPTGRHDQLDRYGLADATGSGAATTTLALIGQAHLLPERNLRARANLSYRLPGAGVTVRGRSGYGTARGHDGRVKLGEAFEATLAAEYSLSPRWVLAGDVLYERQQGARMSTRYDTRAYHRDGRRDGSWRLSVAPAVEYHWSSKVGLIAGAQVSVAGRNSADVFVPQVAVAMGF